MKVDPKSMNASKSTKNDRDQDAEDDSWDDWGDAEDNFEDIQDTKFEPPTIDTEKEKHPTTNSNVQTKKHIAINKTQKLPNINCNKKDIVEWNVSGAIDSTIPKASGWSDLFGGVVSVFNTASEGIGNITSTVSQGLNQVIGVPDPEELARMHAIEVAKIPPPLKQSVDQDTELQVTSQQIKDATKLQETAPLPVFGLNLVSGVATLGTKVLNTGLDTLEGIGKKTMNVLQENDPLLMNKRKLLGLEPDRPNLSEVLKEAKKDADNLENTLKELKLEKSRELLRFDLIFEHNCGLVHLEALEILSKESTLKLQSLQDSVSGNALIELQETINEVKELMELEDLEGESDGEYDGEILRQKLLSTIEDAEIQIGFDDIANNWSQAITWFTSTAYSEANINEVFAKGLTTLSETCALEINKLHKIAELLLVKEHHSTANEVDCVVQVCKKFHTHLNGLTNRFAAILTSKGQNDDDEEAKTYVSTLFAEMLSATKHIDTAFTLFLPILQIGAV